MVRITKYKTRLTEDKKVTLEKEVSVNRPDLSAIIRSPEDVYILAKDFIRLHEESEEYLYMACLNTKNKVTSVFELSHGNVNSSIVGIREMFQKALLANAVSIIVMHNHPSGDCSPSREDVNITKKNERGWRSYWDRSLRPYNCGRKQLLQFERKRSYLKGGGRLAKPFLYDYQMDAVNKMCNGCILNGGVGSGKSRTGLYYYFKEQGGSIDPDYIYMKKPKDLYIITTAMKRDSLEWEGELANFLISTNPEKNKTYGNKVIIDSWNNIKKYSDIQGAFFIFDEDRVTGSGVWVKAFLKIAKSNDWIILSATPGDTWQDYIPVFIANGFYKNKTEFTREHIIYSRFTKYPKIDRYINTGRLIRLRNQILIDMDFSRHTIPHHEDVYCKYDISKYKDATRTRWDPYKNEPIQQASGLCYVLRRIVNEDESRQTALLELFEKHPKMIVFYNFDYELDILKGLYYGENVEIAEWNGHKHQPVPSGEKFIYLVQYNAGAEGWNCIRTDTIVFYSQNYSYKVMQQASGRIDRLNTPYRDLYYYHLKSRSGIDLAISRALSKKKKFNENKFIKW